MAIVKAHPLMTMIVPFPVIIGKTHCEDCVPDGVSNFNFLNKVSKKSGIKAPMTLSVALLVLLSVLWSVYLLFCAILSCWLTGEVLDKMTFAATLEASLLLDGIYGAI